ncbi:MAG: hypothetical protein WC544_02345 [Patescibacteria group bacterium]
MPQRWVVVCIVCFLLLFGGFSVVATWQIGNQGFDQDARLAAEADRVVVDSGARGVVLPVVWYLPDATPVFAADKLFLLEHQAEWLPSLVPGAIVLHSTREEGVASEAGVVIKSIRLVRPVTRLSATWWGAVESVWQIGVVGTGH